MAVSDRLVIVSVEGIGDLPSIQELDDQLSQALKRPVIVRLRVIPLQTAGPAPQPLEIVSEFANPRPVPALRQAKTRRSEIDTQVDYSEDNAMMLLKRLIVLLLVPVLVA